MSEQLKDTSNIVETIESESTLQTTLLEFTEEEIKEYEEGQLTKKEKAKFLLLSPLPNAIIKFSLIGIGLVAAILWLIAAISPAFSNAMVGFYKGVASVLSAINNILPFSVFEIAIVLAVLGWLGYFVFILIRFIQKRKTGKLLSLRYWVQFGYATLAVVMVFTMLFSFGYGLVSNRSAFHNATMSADGVPMYNPFIEPNENDISESLIYLVDKLNTTVINANAENEHIMYNQTSGASKVNVSGDRKAKLANAVVQAFERAAQDIPSLAGPKLKAKAMLAGPIYNGMSVGSMYAPLTGEVLYNPYFPEVAVPMLVARAIAMERGFQNEAQAKLIAYIVCSRYSDVPYVQYSAYFDAYLSTGSKMAQCNPHTYATIASALKTHIKKEVIYYTKKLDKIYGNANSLAFVDNGAQQTANSDYLVLPELLTDYYRQKVAPTVDASIKRNCGYYVNSLISLWQQDAEYQTNIATVVSQYNTYKEEIKQETVTNKIQGGTESQQTGTNQPAA